MRNTLVPNPKRHKWADPDNFLDWEGHNHEGWTLFGMGTFFAGGGAFVGFLLLLVGDLLFLGNPGMGPHRNVPGIWYAYAPGTAAVLPVLFMLWATVYQPLRYPNKEFPNEAQAQACIAFNELSADEKQYARNTYRAYELVMADSYATQVEKATAQGTWNEMLKQIGERRYALNEREKALRVRAADPHLEEAQHDFVALKEDIKQIQAEVDHLEGRG